MKLLLSVSTAFLIAVAPLAVQAQDKPAASINFIPLQSQTEVLGTDFMGTAVYSKDGQKLGDIANLVFDQTGRLETAVIGVGGFLGVGQKEVAVPFDSLTSDVRDKKHVLILDASKDQLKAAPAFKTLNDQSFSQKISDWRSKATDSWAQLKDRASKAYVNAKATVKDQAGKAEDAAEDAGKRAKDAVKDAANRTQDAAKDAATKAQDAAKDAANKADEAVKPSAPATQPAAPAPSPAAPQ